MFTYIALRGNTGPFLAIYERISNSNHTAATEKFDSDIGVKKNMHETPHHYKTSLTQPNVAKPPRRFSNATLW